MSVSRNPYSEDDFDDGDYQLGPFYDSDGEEIIPVGDDAVDIPLNRALGRFLIESRIPEFNDTTVHVTAQIMTEFIQNEWNRMFDGVPSRGFLLMAKGSSAAAGRLAEEVICREIFQGSSLLGSTVTQVLKYDEAVDSGLILKIKRGTRSDDLVLILDDDRIGMLESKSRYTMSKYLKRSKRKATTQLAASLNDNPLIGFVVVALVDLTFREVTIAASDTPQFLTDGLDWPD